MGRAVRIRYVTAHWLKRFSSMRQDARYAEAVSASTHGTGLVASAALAGGPGVPARVERPACHRRPGRDAARDRRAPGQRTPPPAAGVHREVGPRVRPVAVTYGGRPTWTARPAWTAGGGTADGPHVRRAARVARGPHVRPTARAHGAARGRGGPWPGRPMDGGPPAHLSAPQRRRPPPSPRPARRPVRAVPGGRGGRHRPGVPPPRPRSRPPSRACGPAGCGLKR